MATFAPQPTVPRPLPTHFTPSSPPDRPYYPNTPSNATQETVPSYPTKGANRVQHQPSIDFKSNGHNAGFGNGNGGMPVPNGLQHHIPNTGSRHRGTVSMGAFDGPRSPPSTKNTSHVPCKFFRTGQCQAGKACPFSHSTDSLTSDTPCKYFAKGNCKFGAKCALAHILPNGRRVNRPPPPPPPPPPMGVPLNLGGRVDPQLYQQSDPLLAHSLLAQQANGAPLPFNHQLPSFSEHELALQQQQQIRDNLPTINTSYAPNPESRYGSPREDDRNPISPIVHLSVLDAPMPASFDSQGISYIARHGAVAASVPSKFLLESPPNSLPVKTATPTDTVRNLHSSAFGRETRIRLPDLGSSPLGSGDEGFGQRIMHSKRIAKPSIMSASLPRARRSAADDWDDGLFFGGEEDLLPQNLHELLTPQERMRRLSRTEQDSKSHRESLSGVGTPADSASKVGSPHNGSPSRYGALFARQKQEEASSSASAFGHVGSPLRNSSLHPHTSPSMRPTKGAGDLSPSFASPSRQSSMSMISQQLARTKLSSQASDDNSAPTNHNNTLQPGLARHPSTSSNLSNRAVSSSSIGGTGRIEEEQDGVFSMEIEDDEHRKRLSGNAWGYNAEKPAMKMDAIGTGRSPGKSYWG